MSLLQNEDKKVTLFDDANSGFKEHGQGKRERDMSREVRIYGGRQYEAATGSSAAALSAPGKKQTSQEIYS